MRNAILFAACMAMTCNGFAAAPTVSGFLPINASTGITVTITGTGFTGATVVSFGGTSAGSFTVVSSTQITAVLAGGASGSVQVTTVDGAGSLAGFTYIATPGIFAGNALPVHIKTVKATRENNNVLIQWTAYDQQDISQYVVEKSSDGLTFSTQFISLPDKSASTSVNYSWLDQQPSTGNNYYRVKEFYLTGDYDYGATIIIFLSNEKPDISLHPNPVTGRSIHLQFNEMNAGSYHISFINSYGQVVNQQTLVHPRGTQSVILQLSRAVTKGLYTVEILGPGGSVGNYSLVIL